MNQKNTSCHSAMSALLLLLQDVSFGMFIDAKLNVTDIQFVQFCKLTVFPRGGACILFGCRTNDRVDWIEMEPNCSVSV